MEWRAKKWIAVALGFVAPPLAMLYLARARWALAYLLAAITIGLPEFFVLDSTRYPWREYVSLTLLINVACAIHAFKIVSHDPSVRRRPWYSHWYGLTCVVCALFIGMFIARAFLFETFRMSGQSMMPSIPPGSILIIKKLGHGHYGAYGISILRTTPSAQIERGDVVAFRYPKNPDLIFAMRVVGLPGDVVEYKGNRLVVNGLARTSGEGSSSQEYRTMPETLDKASYTIIALRDELSQDFQSTVPPSQFFVLGDNRGNSLDSRHWGSVPALNIVGKLVFVSR